MTTEQECHSLFDMLKFNGEHDEADFTDLFSYYEFANPNSFRADRRYVTINKTMRLQCAIVKPGV